MLDLTNLRAASVACQSVLLERLGIAQAFQTVYDIEALALLLDTLVSEVDKLSNLDLFKVIRTDKEISACISAVISMGVGTMLSMSFEGNKNLIRQPLKSLVERVNNFLDDDAIRRLRVLQ